jgi:hypothetical protein
LALSLLTMGWLIPSKMVTGHTCYRSLNCF